MGRFKDQKKMEVNETMDTVDTEVKKRGKKKKRLIIHPGSRRRRRMGTEKG